MLSEIPVNLHYKARKQSLVSGKLTEMEPFVFLSPT